MDEIDAERMRRVLERVYPPAEGEGPRYRLPDLPPPEPMTPEISEEIPDSPENFRERELIRREQEVRWAMRSLAGRSRECRRVLQEPVRAAGNRLNKLRAEWFLRTGETAPDSGGDSRREPGIFTLLRLAQVGLEELGAAYLAAAGETPGRREMYEFMGAECRAHAANLRRLLERAIQ